MSDQNVPAPGDPLPPKRVDLETIEQGYKLVLEGLGQGDKPEVMKNTARRIAEMLGDVINAPWCDIEIPWKTFPNDDGKGGKLVDDLVIVNDCHYVSMCEHHLAPALGVAHFCYVPNERITGYSKVKKALNYLSRQPQLNERLLHDALDALEAVLEPCFVGLVLDSVHMCLVCKSNAPSQEIVRVQGFRGAALATNPDLAATWRREFTASLNKRSPLFGA